MEPASQALALPPGQGSGGIQAALRAVLVLYSAAGLLAGAAALLLFPVPASFTSTITLPQPWSVPIALALWTLLTAAAFNLGSPDGRGLVLSAGDTAVVAVAVLGGPAAVAVVAALGSTELREIRRVPWYGVAANHGAVVFSWVGGALVMRWVAGLAGATGPSASLAAVVVGAGTAVLSEALLATLLYAARTGLSPVAALSEGFPARFAIAGVSVVSLGSLAAASYPTLGWWSPLLLSAAVLAISRSLAWQRDGWQLRHHQLTALPNALGLREHAADLRRPTEGGLAVLYIDLDGFKAVNDERDHSVGDDVLRVVGKRLRGACRPGDFLAHLHGDEFVVLAPGVSSGAEAEALGARLVAAVEPVIDHASGALCVSATVGHRIVSDSAGLEVAIREADRAMSEAKAAKGRRAGPPR